MTGASQIHSIGSGPDTERHDRETVLDLGDHSPGGDAIYEQLAEPWPDEDAASSALAREWVAPLLATIAVAAWSGFFVWANLGAMRGEAAPALWAQWIVAWSVPVLLVLTAYLLAMRHSRAEAVRFTDIARALSEESQRLEKRLVAVNGELSLAREFVAAQSRDLESLGRVATERLSKNADTLAGLIQDNGEKIDAIATVSSHALENMDKLRGQLPVIATSAKDVTSNIGNAGRSAHTQLQDLVSGFQRLNEFGQASERQVGVVRDQVREAIADLTTHSDTLAGVAERRFAELTRHGVEFSETLVADESKALESLRARAGVLADETALLRAQLAEGERDSEAALRSRIAALQGEADAISGTLTLAEGAATAAYSARLAEISEGVTAVHDQIVVAAEGLGGDLRHMRADMEVAGRSSAEGLRTRLLEIDKAIEAQRLRHAEQARAIADQAVLVGDQLDAFGATMRELGEHGTQVRGSLEDGLGLLAAKLEASRAALSGTDEAVANLTDGSVRLLEIIQASATQTREKLPEALTETEQRLEGLEQRVFMVRDALGEAGTSGQSLSDYVIAARETLGETTGQIDALHEGLARRTGDHRQALAAMREEIAQARSDSEDYARSIDETLRKNIAELDEAARRALGGLRTGSEEAVTAIAGSLGERSAEALRQAMAGQAELTLGELEAAIARVGEGGRQTAMQLRDQLARVDELAGNLERRVDHARGRAEERVNDHFARRVAVISESLNSASIDITKALSTEVTDSAWASYMRGDRGIFTRRAVTLLDQQGVKAVAQHYENDDDFRDNVNHYIHDFEAMLRNLLSTRDGNALGVTLLSSDMGKLYVALAQGIERLRN